MFGIFLQILCYDAWFYVTHILLHKTMYNIHKIHHSTPYNQLNYSSTNVGHWFENALQGLGNFIHLFFVDFYASEFIIASTIIATRALMRHDERCSWLIGNHHLLHHKYIGCNYGEYWIDNIVGTLCDKEHEYLYGKIYT